MHPSTNRDQGIRDSGYLYWFYVLSCRVSANSYLWKLQIFTSEMSPAFNLTEGGQYRNVWLIRPALLHRGWELPLLPWHRPSGKRWEWSKDMNMHRTEDKLDVTEDLDCIITIYLQKMDSLLYIWTIRTNKILVWSKTKKLCYAYTKHRVIFS